jgi:hypothetical protein
LDRCAFDNQSHAIRVGNGNTEAIGCAIRGSTETGITGFGGTFRATDCVVGQTSGRAAVFCEMNGRIEMAGCTIAENLGHGVYAQGAGSVHLSGCAVTDNGLCKAEWSNVAGISFTDAALVRIDRCTVSRNGGPGIEASYLSLQWRIDPSISPDAPPESELYMTDCHVFDNADDGLWLMGAHRVDLVRTTIERNGGAGIEIGEEYEGTLSLIDCRIVENMSTGIATFGAANMTLDGCTILGNVSIGVLIGGESRAFASIHGCHISASLIGVALVQAPRVDLTDCTIAGNAGYGLQIYCLECSGGRHHHSPELDFAGELTGGGNVIPAGSVLDGNGLGGICPADGWEHLRVGPDEASDA